MLIIWPAVPATGEIYKYVDEQGNIHFTDDLNLVPSELRNSVETRTESENNAEIEPNDSAPDDHQDMAAEAASDDGPEPDGDLSATTENIDDQDLNAARKRLEALKREIDGEYNSLVKVKKRLTEKRKSLKSQPEILRYNQAVEELNKRAAVYEKKGKQYQAQVKAYNARVALENSRLNKKGSSPN